MRRSQGKEHVDVRHYQDSCPTNEILCQGWLLTCRSTPATTNPSSSRSRRGSTRRGSSRKMPRTSFRTLTGRSEVQNCLTYYDSCGCSTNLAHYCLRRTPTVHRLAVRHNSHEGGLGQAAHALQDCRRARTNRYQMQQDWNQPKKVNWNYTMY